MKILQVIHSVDPQAGGTTEGLKQLSTALARAGVAVDVLCLDAPDAPWVNGFPFPLFALGPVRGTYGYTSKLLPWLLSHSNEYDLIVVNGLWQFGGFAVWRACRKTRVPYVVFPHGMLDPWFKRQYPLKHWKKWLYWPWGEYRVLRDATAVLFTTEEERIEARKSFWLYQCREEVVGFGIDAPPEEDFLPTGLFLARFPQLAGKRLVLFLGRMHEKKGCDLLLRALQKVLAKSSAAKCSDLHLVMAGPQDGDYAQQMLRLTEELCLGSRVTWTGMLAGDLKWSAFYAAEAFILPSHQENFGVSVAESLACGRPVLVSNKVNIWREIEGDEAGLVANDDLDGTIELLERWLEMAAEKQQSYRVNARSSYERHFHVTNVAARFVSLVSARIKA